VQIFIQRIFLICHTIESHIGIVQEEFKQNEQNNLAVQNEGRGEEVETENQARRMLKSFGHKDLDWREEQDP
jgi:hypothetical protein